MPGCLSPVAWPRREAVAQRATSCGLGSPGPRPVRPGQLASPLCYAAATTAAEEGPAGARVAGTALRLWYAALGLRYHG